MFWSQILCIKRLWHCLWWSSRGLRIRKKERKKRISDYRVHALSSSRTTFGEALGGLEKKKKNPWIFWLQILCVKQLWHHLRQSSRGLEKQQPKTHGFSYYRFHALSGSGTASGRAPGAWELKKNKKTLMFWSQILRIKRLWHCLRQSSKGLRIKKTKNMAVLITDSMH